MASPVVLAIFIASSATFDAGVVSAGAYSRAAFPNSDQGIAQLGQWLGKLPAQEYDQVCVSGPNIDPTPASRFWASRKVPVIAVDYAQVRQYMKKHNIGAASANVVAKTCLALLPRK